MSDKTLNAKCLSVASYLRRGQFGFAWNELDKLLLDLSALLENLPKLATELTPYLNAMLEAQANKNYHYVADLLENEIAPRIMT